MNGWRNLVLVVLVGACVTAHGGWFSGFGKRRVETLVVTGNYAKSRLLGELFQHQTKQPIVLISPEDGGREQLFFLPSVPEAMAFEAAKFAEFVDFLHPNRVVFLGDSSFVPPTYIDQVRGRYPTVVLNSRDWMDNAKALGVVINRTWRNGTAATSETGGGCRRSGDPAQTGPPPRGGGTTGCPAVEHLPAQLTGSP